MRAIALCNPSAYLWVCVDGEDFEVATVSQAFQPGETRQCPDFVVRDDDVVEDPQEDFTVVITEIVTEGVQPGDQSSTTVRIIDDDSKLCLRMRSL